MPLRQLDHATGLIHQLSGDDDCPPVVYLPGVHGDWTPLARARLQLAESVKLVEAAYPRVVDWTLEDFALSLAELLDNLGLESAHLVGESFGSLIAWKFGLTQPDRVRSLILVGGFSRPPTLRKAAFAGRVLRSIPTAVFEAGVDTYVASRIRRGEIRTPSDRGLAPYPAVRTSRGRHATANRMRIIQSTDFRSDLHRLEFPVRYIGGEKDVVVPVAREIETLKQHLPQACGFEGRVLPDAPHVIIASHPHQTSDRITQWVRECEAAEHSAKRESNVRRDRPEFTSKRPVR